MEEPGSPGRQDLSVRLPGIKIQARRHVLTDSPTLQQPPKVCQKQWRVRDEVTLYFILLFYYVFFYSLGQFRRLVEYSGDIR